MALADPTAQDAALESEDVQPPAAETTFYWPLTLDLPPQSDVVFWQRHPLEDFRIANVLDEQIASIDSTIWEEVDGLNHWQGPNEDQSPAGKADRYAEFTYFHDFVQRFLYSPLPKREDWGIKQSRSRGVRFFHRRDITKLTVTLAEQNEPATLDCTVHRVLLAVFATGIAILCVTVGVPEKAKAGARPNLGDIMRFNDRMRRAHAPFYEAKGGNFALPTDQVVTDVKWFTGNEPFPSGQAIDPVKVIDKLIDADCVNTREVPPFAHWSCLLPEKWKVAAAQAHGVTWRHVSDERLPIVSWIDMGSATAYRDISPGDWQRLCFVDSPGTDRFPYAKAFLEETTKRNFYDRYHHAGPDIDSGDPPVRYLISPYSLLAVGSGTFFVTRIRKHMYRHYHQLILLSQMEFAALLGFSSRITLAVTDLDASDNERTKREAAAERFRLAFRAIEHDFLDFVHRFRFTGVSSQLQAREMHDRIREVMGLDRLFEDIKNELSSANDFMHRAAEEKQAAASERLNLIATVGVVVGLGLSVISALNPPSPIGNQPGGSLAASTAAGGVGAYWGAALLILGTIALVAAASTFLLPRLRVSGKTLPGYVLAALGALCLIGSLLVSRLL